MSLVITDEILEKTDFSVEELRIEIAILLYQKQKFSLEQASKFAETTKLEF